MREWYGGRWRREDIDRNERYILRDGLLIHRSGGRVRYYADDNGDSIWTRTTRATAGTTLNLEDALDPVISGGHIASREVHSSFGDDAYRFNLVNGQVTNLQEYDDGTWRRERIEANETWSFDGTNLIQTERERGGREISTFADSNGDGIYTLVSEVFAASI